MHGTQNGKQHDEYEQLVESIYNLCVLCHQTAKGILLQRRRYVFLIQGTVS